MSHDLCLWHGAAGDTLPTTAAQAAIICERLSDELPGAVHRVVLPEDGTTAEIARVVAAAAEQGLVVFDDDNGMCWLPDGTVLPEDMREVWESDLAELAAGPRDPNAPRLDNRTFLQKLASELFDALARGNKRL